MFVKQDCNVLLNLTIVKAEGLAPNKATGKTDENLFIA